MQSMDTGFAENVELVETALDGCVGTFAYVAAVQTGIAFGYFVVGTGSFVVGFVAIVERLPIALCFDMWQVASVAQTELHLACDFVTFELPF